MKHTENLSFTLLSKDKLTEGLDESGMALENTKISFTTKTFFTTHMDGKEDLNDKRILIWYEQGIGDT